MSWHDFALIAPLLSAWIETLLIVLRIEVGRSGSTVSQDIGNKLTSRLFCLSLHLDRNDPEQLAGSQFIREEMRMWERGSCWNYSRENLKMWWGWLRENFTVLFKVVSDNWCGWLGIMIKSFFILYVSKISVAIHNTALNVLFSCMYLLFTRYLHVTSLTLPGRFLSGKYQLHTT